jgi:hypothetical protein
MKSVSFDVSLLQTNTTTPIQTCPMCLVVVDTQNHGENQLYLCVYTWLATSSLNHGENCRGLVGLTVMAAAGLVSPVGTQQTRVPAGAALVTLHAVLVSARASVLRWRSNTYE